MSETRSKVELKVHYHYTTSVTLKRLAPGSYFTPRESHTSLQAGQFYLLYRWDDENYYFSHITEDGSYHAITIKGSGAADNLPVKVFDAQITLTERED